MATCKKCIHWDKCFKKDGTRYYGPDIACNNVDRLCEWFFEKGNGVTFATDTNDGGKWIPVTERLPEECKDVLVYRSTGCEVDSCVSHRKAHWSYDPVSKYPVTHWMPLPNPPKEG